MKKGDLDMWIWIAVLSLLFIIFEESIYYFWNRYVYGRKETKPKYWKNRIAVGISFLIRIKYRESRHKHNHKMSS